ncbi:hypothetical protein GCM10023238_17920 [Streptomyces heliomycini]
MNNPYDGAKVYVNPEWSEKAAAEPGGSRIANQPTGVWLDRTAAINGVNGGMSLRDHLDEALRQKGSGELVIQLVIYNLPGRDCAALASNGELGPTEIDKYKTQYIDPIKAILADSKYASLRIVTTVEIDSLPNLVTTSPRGHRHAQLRRDEGQRQLRQGRRLRPQQARRRANVYNYVDAGHHGWLGWDDNFGASAEMFKQGRHRRGRDRRRRARLHRQHGQLQRAEGGPLLHQRQRGRASRCASRSGSAGTATSTSCRTPRPCARELVSLGFDSRSAC